MTHKAKRPPATAGGAPNALSCRLAEGNPDNKPSVALPQDLPSRATLARPWREVEPAQVRRVAQRIHACGPRVAFEFVADLARGRRFAETVADFGRLDPALYAAVMALVCDGGHA